MLRILIKDIAAFDELKEAYGVGKFMSILDTMRRVIPKLLSEDDMLDFVFPMSFFSETYQQNIQQFVANIKLKGIKVLGSRDAADGTITIRAGIAAFGVPTFGFAKNLTRELEKHEIYHVDVVLTDIPKSYRANIFHLCNRLTKRIGIPIKHMVLADTIRFIKPPPLPKNKRK